MKTKWLLSSLLCLISWVGASAQEFDSIQPVNSYNSLMQLSSEQYLSLQVPPLHTLLENARNSPQVAFYASNKSQEERGLKTIRRSWLRYIKLNGNYNYGSTNAYVNNFNSLGDPYAVNTTNDQSWYTVGVSLSLPLEEIFNRRNRIQQQKEKINSIQFEVDRWYDDLSLKIIDAYTSAMQNLAILQSVTEAMMMAKAQYKISESDFINGAIDAQALSRQRNIQNVSIREFEETRALLTNALLRLEILSHTKIINR
ncbi:MAG: TolC family protein [Alistipes sp.]